MPNSPSPAEKGRPLTFTEQARRTQLIGATIDLIAELGYSGTSLARIAESAGITKAAVLYHFPSKDAVVRAAHKQVLDSLVETVRSAVEAAGPRDAPSAYVRSMVGHLREHPQHTRVIIEAANDTGDLAHTKERWGPLASLLTEARTARGLEDEPDVRTLAIIISGAIDSMVIERLNDPAYDTSAAAEVLVAIVERTLDTSP